MKTPYYLCLFLILSAFFFSCNNSSYIRELHIADSLIATNPDSAIPYLLQLEEKVSIEPKSIKMLHKLFTIKAHDKAYILHTSDSIIMQIVEYYEKNSDQHLSEAYYYAGRVYSDLSDMPRALHYFQKAISLQQSNSDYKLTSKVYSQIGTLLLYQDIYSEAMTAFRKAYQYSRLENDSISIIFNLRDIGSAFVGFGNADSALHYYKKAYIKAKKLNQWKCINMMQGELTKLYTQLHQYNVAKKMLDEAMQNPYRPNKSGLYSIAAELYERTGNLDSARYFYHILIDSGTIYAKQSSHLGLSRIALKEKNSQSLMSHIEQYIVYCDSIQKIIDTEVIGRMQASYNYQLHEKENLSLKAQNEHQKVWLLSILLSLISVIAFIAFYILYNKQQRAQWKERVKKLETLKEEQYKKSISFIQANELKIQELENKLQANIIQNASMKQLLQAQKEQLQCVNNQVEADQKEQETAIIAFRQSDIYLKFHQAHDIGEIKAEDWQELQTNIDATFKKFSARLYSLYPLSAIELKICLLIKADINTSNIALLTGRTKSAITSARKKLYEKIYGKKESPEKWDQFIQSL